MKDNQLTFEEWNTGVSRTKAYGLLTDEGNSAGISVHECDINGKEYPAKATAELIVATWNSYTKNCRDRAVECAESDLLGECLGALGRFVYRAEELQLGSDYSMRIIIAEAKAILSKHKESE